jgi:hypothetical protein
VIRGRPQSLGGSRASLAKQIVENAAYPLDQDPGLDRIALGGFQVARDPVPAGAVVAAYAECILQLLPPLPLHGQSLRRRERLPDHHVAVTLEALDV